MKDPIVQAGDPILRQRAVPVARKDIGGRKLAALIRTMERTLKGESLGVAIAAPQVGASLRVFVIAGRAFITTEEKKAFEKGSDIATPPAMVFINPEITRLSKKTAEMSEGCLSVRDKYGTVLRHEKATVVAYDQKGKQFTYHGSGLIAHIFQHEIDHLDGILYIDKAIKLEEDEDIASARQKLKKKHDL